MSALNLCGSLCATVYTARRHTSRPYTIRQWTVLRSQHHLSARSVPPTAKPNPSQIHAELIMSPVTSSAGTHQRPHCELHPEHLSSSPSPRFCILWRIPPVPCSTEPILNPCASQSLLCLTHRHLLKSMLVHTYYLVMTHVPHGFSGGIISMSNAASSVSSSRTFTSIQLTSRSSPGPDGPTS